VADSVIDLDPFARRAAPRGDDRRAFARLDAACARF
jgi:hypothetical protein